MQVLAEADGDTALIRSAADIFSAAAAIGSDAVAASLLKVLCKEVQEPRTPDYQRFAVLAVGGVHSAKGGMALRRYALVCRSFRPVSRALVAILAAKDRHQIPL